MDPLREISQHYNRESACQRFLFGAIDSTLRRVEEKPNRYVDRNVLRSRQPLEFVEQLPVFSRMTASGISSRATCRAAETTGYDTICHEHVEYYALRQIEWMIERAGCDHRVELNDVNGGVSADCLQGGSSLSVKQASYRRRPKQ